MRRCLRIISERCLLPPESPRRDYNCLICDSIREWATQDHIKVVVAEIPGERLLIRAVPEDVHSSGALMEFRLGWVKADEARAIVNTLVDSAVGIWLESATHCSRLK
ncbi:MAG: hypothetical protein JNK87_10660 [Bryobacterales bacterium]|nr:hypothetical protein [Bryobacterales bacterium]